MTDQDLGRRAAGVGLLADPIRRDLYQYVIAQDAPVSREQASAALGIAHHTVKFHLDRLVEAGLLETEFRRPPGRTGPGAGRPTKLYRRATAEVAVSLPQRRYDLASALMAQAIDTSVATGQPVLQALHEVAAARGAAFGAEVREGAEVPDGVGAGDRTEVPDGVGPVDAPGAPAEVAEADDVATAACTALSDLGYEPRLADGEITLRSCPFHALVADHTSLVCGLNLALLDGLADVVGPGRLTARLEPAEGRCSVLLTLRSPGSAELLA
jgi:predicted ArsR family transcriptional regulator